MYHIVWIPKYRKRVLKGAIARKLKLLLKQCAEINGWRIETLSIKEDHVHVLVQLKPNMSVSKAIQLFKGGTSRVLRKMYPELEEFLWGDSFWADGYFAETVGHVDMATIKRYVENQ